MEPTPESLAALLAVIAGSAIAVAIVTVRLLRSGRTVPPPWGGPPARRRR